MSEPTLAEIVRSALDSRLADVWTALPCRIESYDAAAQTVNVLPMVRRAITDTEGATQHEDLPILPNVPVLFPSSGAFSATWPLSAGDFVLVVLCATAIGNWRETGDLSNPGDLRRHDLSHGFAIPGAVPQSVVYPSAPDAAILEVNAPATHVKVGIAATSFVALNDLVMGELVKIAAAIGGPPGGYLVPVVPPFVGSIKLKAE